MKLSHSKKEKYDQCPRRYYFHYEKRFRSKDLNSPLFFGVATDEAINRMLLEKKKELATEESELMKSTPEEVFLKYMNEVRHNSKTVQIKDFELATYTKADFDSTMLNSSDLEAITDYYNDNLGLDSPTTIDIDFVEDYMEWMYQERKKKEVSYTSGDLKFFNLLNWYSLKGKGLMILEVYREEIMPQIHEVFSIQKAVSLENGTGDEIVGLIDFVASFTDEPDKKYIVDNKSASKAYKEKDLTESKQLHLYSYDQEIPNIAYIIYEKNIRKRDPRVRINILKGESNVEFTEGLLDEFEEVLGNIKAEKFQSDFDSGCNFFRRRCEYYDICHRDTFNGDILVNLNKGKK